MDRKTNGLAVGSSLVFVLMIAAGIYLATRDDPNLIKCEDALKATLKAPATYKRVKFHGFGGPDGFYDIEYDANNSFNAPLRGNGTCLLTKGHARWADFSSLPS